MVEAFVF